MTPWFYVPVYFHQASIFKIKNQSYLPATSPSQESKSLVFPLCHMYCLLSFPPIWAFTGTEVTKEIFICGDMSIEGSWVSGARLVGGNIIFLFQSMCWAPQFLKNIKFAHIKNKEVFLRCFSWEVFSIPERGETVMMHFWTKFTLALIQI